jgi:hypothetical protein
MATTYNETRVNLKITLPGGKVEEEVSVKEEKAQELIEEAQGKADGTSVEITAAQTFTFHSVSETEPLTDFQAFVPSVEEQANLINRAIILKQQQYVRRMLMAKDFTPVDGAYDLQPVIGAVSERQTASPEQKAANALSKMLGRNVSTEELANIIASLGAAQAA